MKTGAIQGGIAPDRRAAARAASGWMIPILMTVFALGGTTFGMAEESLAFYVADHHGHDRGRLRRARRRGDPPARLRHRRARLDDQPVRDRHRLRASPASRSSEGLVGRLVILVVGTAIGIVFVMRYAGTGQGRPDALARLRPEGRQRGPLPGRDGCGRRRGAADRPPEGRPRPVLPGLRRDDLRRHPVGGPRHRAADPVVVVPGDDRLVPVLRDPHRRRRPDGGGRASRRHVRRRRARPARASR